MLAQERESIADQDEKFFEERLFHPEAIRKQSGPPFLGADAL